ncbi:MAG: DUF1800 domain-containing protein [Ignavibacteriales bacterium]|nr:DUF1800 domain-containing protein [Ignavibacteriales bacterium]
MSVWDADAARHILSRSLFGFTKDDVASALTKTLDDFVDNYLLKDLAEPAAPQYNGADWVTLPNNTTNQTNYTNWFRSMIYWWYNLMLTQGYSIREKMVLFLHNHFVSEYGTVQIPQFMYIQNKLLRQYAFGNFIELTKKVTIDPAMLIYLNGNVSTKTAPNENYARELQELFTIGIGNYTEDDIKQMAKALTGWTVDGTNLVSVFNSSRADTGSKTIYGKTGNYTYDTAVNLIFTEKIIPASEFLCRKLYKEFAYYEPNTDYVTQLAAVMRTNNFNLKPVLSTMLKSEYFHSVDIRGARIKPPVEFLLSALKQLGISYTNNDLPNYIRTTADSLQQSLFNPPDVRGWEGQRKWISTITYPNRNVYTDALVNGKTISSISYKMNVLAYSRSYPSSENAVQFVEDVTKQLIQFPLSQARKDSLLSTMLDGTVAGNWSTYSPGADTRLQKFFKALMRLPEFQLS